MKVDNQGGPAMPMHGYVEMAIDRVIVCSCLRNCVRNILSP